MHHLSPEVAAERLIKTLRAKGISDEKVLNAFRAVPRHLFVDGAMYAQAYDDNALPIGYGQTISQPYVQALMTQCLRLETDLKILEIGTGSGFQTALLAQFSRRVYTIERHTGLGETARKRLRNLGYENIIFKVGDGTRGWVAHAPFDRIIVTAGAPVMPHDMLKQLGPNGIMVIPVGDRTKQELEIYTKSADGSVAKEAIGGVIFVPLIGQNGWKS